MVPNFEKPRRKSAICRREIVRSKVPAYSVTYWSDRLAPTKTSAIEVDNRGARLMLPAQVIPGDSISVSVADELGQFRTYGAQVVWTHRLAAAGKVIAGVVFGAVQAPSTVSVVDELTEETTVDSQRSGALYLRRKVRPRWVAPTLRSA